MPRSSKALKITSIVILILTAMTLLELATELFLGDFKNVPIPEGAPDNIIFITQMFVLAVSFILLLPQIYVGFKGLKVANNPDSSKGHIFWATIIFIILISNLISPILALVKQEEVAQNVRTILRTAVEVIVYYDYFKYARDVAN